MKPIYECLVPGMIIVSNEIILGNKPWVQLSVTDTEIPYQELNEVPLADEDTN